MCCAIWYHSYNLKNVKSIHGRVLLLAKLQAKAWNFTKGNTPPWVFLKFLKLYKWYQIVQRISNLLNFPASSDKNFGTNWICRNGYQCDFQFIKASESKFHYSHWLFSLLGKLLSTQSAFTSSKSTIETPEQCVKSGVIIINFEQISSIVLLLLWLTLNK